MKHVTALIFVSVDRNPNFGAPEGDKKSLRYATLKSNFWPKYTIIVIHILFFNHPENCSVIRAVEGFIICLELANYQLPVAFLYIHLPLAWIHNYTLPNSGDHPCLLQHPPGPHPHHQPAHSKDCPHDPLHLAI